MPSHPILTPNSSILFSFDEIHVPLFLFFPLFAHFFSFFLISFLYSSFPLSLPDDDEDEGIENENRRRKRMMNVHNSSFLSPPIVYFHSLFLHLHRYLFSFSHFYRGFHHFVYIVLFLSLSLFSRKRKKERMKRNNLLFVFLFPVSRLHLISNRLAINWESWPLPWSIPFSLPLTINTPRIYRRNCSETN